ncbi:MAG: membrane integrity-associated transporter subunit PqiC [Elusimicrobiaceae bacterium]|nr:membrane integrity-associated transporter subunit PqiC [Elusimicrobiaceae bacterium]MBP5616434.1 membrane integrity-associated transporter subunit PqiC [Elusimicrobiaceae bacterium]
MRLLKIIIPCLLLGACFWGTSQNAKFYTQSATATQTLSSDYVAFVGVNRVQLPRFMDRPQILTQVKDSSQVNISEYNRWVELPSVLATRVLTEDLGILLPAAQIKMNQFQGEGFDRVVSVEVIEMNAILGDKAELVAWYTVKNNSTKKILTRQKFESTMEIGKTYDDLAQGYSTLLAQLSQEIASVLIKK